MGWGLMLPSLVFLSGFTVYPIAKALMQSFVRINVRTKAESFGGWFNYQNVLKDPIFGIVIGNTLKFAAVVIPLSIVVGFLLALLVSKNLKGIGVVRALIFYPNIAPVIGFATIWTYLLTPTIGLASVAIRATGLIPVDFLNDPRYAPYTIMFVYLWREAGFMMIFYISAIQNISQEYFEAAYLDGASPFTIMRKITIPLVQPTTLFALTITMANAFKMVDLIMIMTTRGGPNNSTNLLMHHIYLTAFTYWDQGQAAVLTIVMLGFMLLVALVQFMLLDKKTHYEN